MTDIYEQHTAAFKNISAFVICDKSGNRVATIAFKYGNAVTCYLHIIGLEMTKGRANGGGYDRKSAAARDAVLKTHAGSYDDIKWFGEDRKAITQALIEGDKGGSWDSCLRDAGYVVHQAV